MPFTSHCLYFHPWLFLDLATYGCCYSCFDSKNAFFLIIILFLSISRAAFDKCLMELNEAGIASISTFLNKDGGLDLTSNSGIVLCLKEKILWSFPIWPRNRLISDVIEPVLNHTEKHVYCIAELQTIFHSNIYGKLSVIRCENIYSHILKGSVNVKISHLIIKS